MPCGTAAACVGSDGAVVRNNVFQGSGSCSSRFDFSESCGYFSSPLQVAPGNPTAFRNNALDNSGAQGDHAYYNFGSPVTTMDELNALTDMASGGNFLSAAQCSPLRGEISPCVNAGTTESAPTDDIDGELRDDQPDVGADEWTPPP
jgi:hypothetical protein